MSEDQSRFRSADQQEWIHLAASEDPDLIELLHELPVPAVGKLNSLGYCNRIVLTLGNGMKHVVFADTEDKFAVELAGDVIQMWQKVPEEE